MARICDVRVARSDSRKDLCRKLQEASRRSHSSVTSEAHGACVLHADFNCDDISHVKRKSLATLAQRCGVHVESGEDNVQLCRRLQEALPRAPHPKPKLILPSSSLQNMFLLVFARATAYACWNMPEVAVEAYLRFYSQQVLYLDWYWHEKEHRYVVNMDNRYGTHVFDALQQYWPAWVTQREGSGDEEVCDLATWMSEILLKDNVAPKSDKDRDADFIRLESFLAGGLYGSVFRAQRHPATSPIREAASPAKLRTDNRVAVKLIQAPPNPTDPFDNPLIEVDNLRYFSKWKLCPKIVKEWHAPAEFPSNVSLDPPPMPWTKPNDVKLVHQTYGWFAMTPCEATLLNYLKMSREASVLSNRFAHMINGLTTLFKTARAQRFVHGDLHIMNLVVNNVNNTHDPPCYQFIDLGRCWGDPSTIEHNPELTKTVNLAWAFEFGHLVDIVYLCSSCFQELQYLSGHSRTFATALIIGLLDRLNVAERLQDVLGQDPATLELGQVGRDMARTFAKELAELGGQSFITEQEKNIRARLKGEQDKKHKQKSALQHGVLDEQLGTATTLLSKKLSQRPHETTASAVAMLKPKAKARPTSRRSKVSHDLVDIANMLYEVQMGLGKLIMSHQPYSTHDHDRPHSPHDHDRPHSPRDHDRPHSPHDHDRPQSTRDHDRPRSTRGQSHGHDDRSHVRWASSHRGTHGAGDDEAFRTSQQSHSRSPAPVS